LAVAVFIGIGLVWKEVQRRTIYSILSKPIRRHEFVIGKYLGLVLTLIVNVTVMTVAFYGVLTYLGWNEQPAVRASWPAPVTDPQMLAAILLILVELMLMTAVALLFSTFSTPFLSAALTIGVWSIGHLNSELRGFPDAGPSGGGWLTFAISYVVPNLAAFDVKTQVVYGEPVALGYLALALLYGATYIALVVCGAAVIFSRRDL
jgi:ABC-type Na+ efflux pump permease subunit